MSVPVTVSAVDLAPLITCICSGGSAASAFQSFLFLKFLISIFHRKSISREEKKYKRLQAKSQSVGDINTGLNQTAPSLRGVVVGMTWLLASPASPLMASLTAASLRRSCGHDGYETEAHIHRGVDLNLAHVETRQPVIRALTTLLQGSQLSSRLQSKMSSSPDTRAG